MTAGSRLDWQRCELALALMSNSKGVWYPSPNALQPTQPCLCLTAHKRLTLNFQLHKFPNLEARHDENLPCRKQLETVNKPLCQRRSSIAQQVFPLWRRWTRRTCPVGSRQSTRSSWGEAKPRSLLPPVCETRGWC